jgi:hypothetical protein
VGSHLDMARHLEPAGFTDTKAVDVYDAASLGWLFNDDGPPKVKPLHRKMVGLTNHRLSERSIRSVDECGLVSAGVLLCIT